MDQAVPRTSGATLPDRLKAAMLEPEAISRLLGWVSIGLGAYEVTRAGRLVRMTGGWRSGTTRLFGLREIATGIGILNARDPAPWIWGRVGGDGLDLLALLLGFGRSGAKARRTLAIGAVAGITALDILSAQRVGRAGVDRPVAEFSARRSLTMRGDAASLRAKWQDPALLAQVMEFVAELDGDADGSTRWTVNQLFGRDLPGGLLAWHTKTAATDAPDRLLLTAGSTALPVSLELLFRPADARLARAGGEATIVTMELRLGPADAVLARSLVRLVGSLPLAPLVDKALHRFKSLVETGEIPTTAHQPAARPDPR